MSQVESPKPTKERLPHSRWGSLSFALAILSIGVFCVSFAVHAYLIITVPGFHPPQNSNHEYPTWRFVMLFGSFYLGCMFVSFVAFVFGIIGVSQSHTRKVFAIWGMLLSAPFSSLFVVSVMLVLVASLPEIIALFV